jgi:beta-galactosidase
MTPALGVCYYPEQWPEEKWAADAAGMAAAGITWVRIGEFAWNRIEPKPGHIELDWLRRVMDLLHVQGLKVVLGTPTAAPPRWLLKKLPDMAFVDAQGRALRFGSRRHYCFSNISYRKECARIVQLIAEGVKHHPALAAWQIDNEYGCNDTTQSYSPSALSGFRKWLKGKYGTIGALNAAWGNSFWSMAYDAFDQIDFPTLTPAQPAPTHRLDFARYSSDQVVAFNKVQVDVIKAITPAVPICTNYMAMTTSFDHFAIGEDLDFASWDSYPLGYIENREGQSPRKVRYAQTGDPDMQGFHHDLSRSIGKGRFWIMEQQPGPVNWAPHNNDPLPGMARLWAWEAFSHGAEAVCYFRWRQAPFAQEQMHAGLLRPDSQPAPALAEVMQVRAELNQLPETPNVTPGDCAIVYDYESSWAWQIQPQSRGFSHFDAAFAQYRQLRKLGLNVDLISSRTPDLLAYKLVFVPALFSWNESLLSAISAYDGYLVIGPRSGSKTADFAIPDALPPALSANLLDVKVVRVASLAPDTPVGIAGGGKVEKWLEKLETSATPLFRTQDGWPLLVAQGRVHYLAGLLDDEGHRRVTMTLVAAAGLETLMLPPGLRMRSAGSTNYLFNYGPETHDLRELGFAGPFGLDGPVLAPAGVATMPR